MNASSKIAAAANGLTADARKVSPQAFLAEALCRFMPAPPPSRVSEQADAARRYIATAWASDDVPTLRTAFEREKAEIDARWTEIRPARHFGKQGVGA